MPARPSAEEVPGLGVRERPRRELVVGRLVHRDRDADDARRGQRCRHGRRGASTAFSQMGDRGGGADSSGTGSQRDHQIPDPAGVSCEPVAEVSRRRPPPERKEHDLDEDHASSQQAGKHRRQKSQWPREHDPIICVPALQRRTDRLRGDGPQRGLHVAVLLSELRTSWLLFCRVPCERSWWFACPCWFMGPESGTRRSRRPPSGNSSERRSGHLFPPWNSNVASPRSTYSGPPVTGRRREWAYGLGLSRSLATRM
jgi:hypothetical protein